MSLLLHLPILLKLRSPWIQTLHLPTTDLEVCRERDLFLRGGAKGVCLIPVALYKICCLVSAFVCVCGSGAHCLSLS